jgi:DNA (cytosine-5)-methyltransferase 1
MKFVSLFAGVGGFDLGLENAGMTCVGQVEIDKQAVSVLEKHWPDVPRHDNVQTAKEWANEQGLVGNVDLVCGGFPCQDLSIGGHRAGLAGERSGLFYDALDFASHVGAKWILLENVPGLFSSNSGHDFAAVISSLRNAGYSYVEWRVFNSQFYGVPQRRRRVYIIGHIGDPSRFPVFVERESGSGSNNESDTQRQDTTAGTAQGSGTYSVFGKTGYAAYSDGVATLRATSHKRPEDNIVVGEG